MRSRVRLCVVLLASAPLLAETRSPTALTVNGRAAPRNIQTPDPTFGWTFDGKTTNWQIEVDDDAAFSRCPSACYYWRVAPAAAGKKVDARSASRADGVSKTGGPSGAISIGAYAGLSHFRVRVCTDPRGCPTEDDPGWSPWASSSFRWNQHPDPPMNLTVTAGTHGSSDPVVRAGKPNPPRTFHVAPAGSDGSSCADRARGTQDAPWRTLQFSTACLRPNDTLIVREGVYAENVVISATNGHVDGTRNNPITVKAFPGERPIVRPSSGNGWVFMKMSGWVLDGLTYGTLAGGGDRGFFGALAIRAGSSHIAIRNCAIDPESPKDGTPQGRNWTGIALGGGSAASELTVEGCTFDQSTFWPISNSGATGSTIRNNTFRVHCRNCIIGQGTQGGYAMHIKGNLFQDVSVVQSAISLYYTSDGATLEENVFDDVSGGSEGVVHVIRSGHHWMKRNTSYTPSRSVVAFEMEDQSAANTLLGNLIQGGIGFAWRNGTSTLQTVDYNTCFSCSSVDTGNLNPPGLTHPRIEQTTTAPGFRDAAGGDFAIGTGSAHDTGPPGFPVPAGGGRRADRGRYERGSTLPYSYQPLFSVADTTPTISWEFCDIDGVSSPPAGCTQIGDGGPVNAQGAYQVQIDTVNTFDSQGPGWTLIDSGTVTSAAQSYTVPASAALPKGQYYFRVRTRDDQSSPWGPWSDANHAFLVVESAPAGQPRR